jgi:hypothetical protein
LADALANQRHEGQRQCDRHAGSRQGIDRASVEVRLVDHPGNTDRRAEARRNRRGKSRGTRAKPSRCDRREGDRDDREGMAEKDEHARSAGLDPGSARVVEVLRRQSRIRREGRERDRREERPDDQSLRQPRTALLIRFRASLD